MGNDQPSGEPEEIPTAAFCVVRHHQSEAMCLVTRDADHRLFEAILLWAQTHWATTRSAKYLTPYRALESLAVPATVPMRAIRHSLAHSTSRLRDPVIVAALQGVFGGTNIDFSKHTHKKEFYRCLGELLQLVDQSLYDALLAAQSGFLRVRSRDLLLAPFEEDALGLPEAAI